MRGIIREMLVFRIRVNTHPVERQRFDTGRKCRIGVAILGPSIHFQQEIAHPARPQGEGAHRREIAAFNSSPEPMITMRRHRPAAVPAHRHIAYKSPGVGFQKDVAETGRYEVCVGLFPLPDRFGFREAAEMQVRRDERRTRLRASGSVRILAQKDLIPVDAKVGDNAKLAAGGEETADRPR